MERIEHFRQPATLGMRWKMSQELLDLPRGLMLFSPPHIQVDQAQRDQISWEAFRIRFLDPLEHFLIKGFVECLMFVRISSACSSELNAISSSQAAMARAGSFF